MEELCSPPSKKANPSVSWDDYGLGFRDTGILIVDYLQKAQTIDVTYYASLRMQLRENIKVKRRGKLSKGLLFHQDNAPAHTSRVERKTSVSQTVVFPQT